MQKLSIVIVMMTVFETNTKASQLYISPIYPKGFPILYLDFPSEHQKLSSFTRITAYPSLKELDNLSIGVVRSDKHAHLFYAFHHFGIPSWKENIHHIGFLRKLSRQLSLGAIITVVSIKKQETTSQLVARTEIAASFNIPNAILYIRSNLSPFINQFPSSNLSENFNIYIQTQSDSRVSYVASLYSKWNNQWAANIGFDLKLNENYAVQLISGLDAASLQLGFRMKKQDFNFASLSSIDPAFGFKSEMILSYAWY